MKKGGIITIDLSAKANGTVSEIGSWMLVFPAGSSNARDGRGPFHLKDKFAMQSVIDRTLDYLGGIEAMVDYDHALDKVGEAGATAKAAGWVKEWEARESGIWAFIAWTDAARSAIKSQEYRYLSPYFTSDADNNVHQFLNIALVNHPALDLEAIAAKAEIQKQQRTDQMNFMQKLAKKLGLEDGASEEAILTAVGKMPKPEDDKKKIAAAVEAGVTEAIKPIALAAGMSEDDEVTAEALATKVKGIADAGEPAGDKDETIIALKSTVTELGTKLNALQASTGKKDAESFVDNAIQEGRVGVKPLRDHYITRFAASPEGAKAVQTEINALPSVSGTTIVSTAPDIKDGKVALSVDQKAIADMQGIDHEEFAKTLADEAAA